MKLIYINGAPTSMVFGLKLDAWWFNENGFDVEFWDTSPLYFSKNQLDKYYGGNEEYKYIGPKHRVFRNKNELLKSIKELDNTKTKIFYLSRTIYKILDDDDIILLIQSKKLKYYFQLYSSISEPNNLYENLKHMIIMLKHKILNNKITPTACFGSGSLTRKYAENMYPKSFFSSIPSVEIKWKVQKRIIQNDYVVFVDEAIEYAPDAKMLGYSICNDLDGYYFRMNKLFEKIEKWTGLPVVIGASGKYIYPKNNFNKRQIIYQKTFSLIEHSNLIIGHTSSALKHNIKCNKPIVFIKDKSFTNIKLKGFKELKNIFNDKVYDNDKFHYTNYQDIINFDNNRYIKINDDCFNEKYIDNDYREIQKLEFEREIHV
jgi:hypothetical protein